MKVYVAGPITGIPDGNRPQFEAAVFWLRANTHWEIISPLEMDTPEEFVATMTDHYGSVYWQRMVEDFKMVVSVDGLVLLAGWEKSKGVRIEVLTALSTNKKLFLWYPDELIPASVDAIRETLAEAIYAPT